jgi:hypothetical protein
MLNLGVFRNVNMNKTFILFVGLVGSLSLSAMNNNSFRNLNNDQLQAAQDFQLGMGGRNLLHSQIIVLSENTLATHQRNIQERRLAGLQAQQSFVERSAGIVPRPLRSRSNSFTDLVAQAVLDAQNEMDVVEILEDLDINENHQGRHQNNSDQ